MVFNLTLSTWNANGLSNKKAQLIQFLQDHKIDIMLLNETKLTNRDKLKITGYNTVRKDRQNNIRAGGVAMLIRNEVPYQLINTDDNNSTIEHITIKLKDDTYITSVYNQPRNNYSRQDMLKLLDVGQKVLLIGDLNAKHTTWNNRQNNRNGNTLFDISHICPILIMHPNNHTHFPANGSQPTTIDIIVNKNVTAITNPETLQDLDSDHDPLVMQLSQQTINDTIRHIVIWKKVNWSDFRNTLDRHININNRILTAAQIDEEVVNLTNAIQIAQKRHCKKIVVKAIKDKLPSRILELIAEKRRARKKWQRTGLQQDKNVWSQLARIVRESIKEHTNNTWSNKLSKLSHRDNSLWKLTKALKNTWKSIPSLKRNNDVLMTDEGKAEAIASHFQEVHHLDQQMSNEQETIKKIVSQIAATAYIIPERKQMKYLTDANEIKTTAKTFSNDKAPGEDEITYRVIKNLSNKAFTQLTSIINAIIKQQYFPSTWKRAVIIPIAKPGKDVTLPGSYRPISLLSGLSKLTEKIILKRLEKMDKKLRITPNNQFGFRSGHSTTHQIARIITDIKAHFNKHQNTTMMLLDMQKAFDRVWTEGLIYKMSIQQIPLYMCRLIHSYLTKRTFTVRINNAKSHPKTIAAGVPQGSVLGPKLYTLYISDLPLFEKTKTAVYADDTAIYSHSYYTDVARKQLQIHNNILQPYFKKWKLTMNAEKTEIINFTKKFTNNKIYTNLKIQEQTITPVHNVKYLGVILDDKLTFREHIASVIKKGYISLKYAYPLMVSTKLTTQTKVLIYKTIIRPILTYAGPAWCGAAPTNIRKLQRFENKCLRLAVGAGRYIRLHDLYEQADITRLTDHIQEQAQVLYTKTTTSNNPLISDITSHREEHGRLKHKLPYQHLPIFEI